MSRRRLAVRSQIAIFGLMLILLVVYLADITINYPNRGFRPFVLINGTLMMLSGLLTIVFRREHAEILGEARQPRQGIEWFGAWEPIIQRRPWVDFLIGARPEPAVFIVRGAIFMALGLLFVAGGLIDLLFLRR